MWCNWCRSEKMYIHCLPGCTIQFFGKSFLLKVFRITFFFPRCLFDLPDLCKLSKVLQLFKKFSFGSWKIFKKSSRLKNNFGWTEKNRHKIKMIFGKTEWCIPAFVCQSWIDKNVYGKKNMDFCILFC